jgi:hypothetical protein
MTAERSILSLKYNPVGIAAGARRAIGGFLRYIQYRDHHQDLSPAKDVEGLVRYVAHRDRATAQGRLFSRQGPASDLDRKAISRYIARSVKGLEETAPSRGRALQRACYRMVISPESAGGLDLRQLTRAVMRRLELELGTDALPPWIAAEHRNTAHPHVHVVLAARREVAPGRFRALIITRPRLARIKQEMMQEIARQRGERQVVRQTLSRSAARVARHCRSHPRARARSLFLQLHRDLAAPALARRASWLAARLARRYHWEAEQVAERGGWERER